MTLRELLMKYKIEIPMLQRDYAQGRKSQEKIANEFLASIFNVLHNNTKKDKLHIDFIYGYEDNGKFYLIDGQQRITTLWLLHFYLYKKVDRLEEVRKYLQNFSYATRRSSKEFCKNLLQKDFDLNEYPSQAIKNKGGAFESEKNLDNDPTIKAMLHMLDLIFTKIDIIKDISKIIDGLDRVTFELFNMENFGLGEELYIKMNARGKQLSNFEKLKAFIEKSEEVKKDTELLTSMDTDWSDYFFESKNPNSFDKTGFHFLHYSSIFFHLENNKNLNIKEYLENIEQQSINEFYHPLRNLQNIQLLNRTIEFFLLFDSFELDEELKDDFKKMKFSEELTYSNICYFFSILFFMKNNNKVQNINNKALNDYLRLNRHLIQNHRLDKPDYIKSFYSLFEFLQKGCNNIYKFLVSNEYSNSFHSNIYKLETNKAKLILSSRNGDQNWEKILNKTSKHKILIGWVDFLLEFSKTELGFDLNKFKQYSNLTMEIFDHIEEDKGFKKFLPLFQRSYLSIGDYGFWATNYFYGNNYPSIFRDREAWNQLLNPENDKDCFKRFLDLLLLKSDQIKLEDKMQNIINQCNLLQKEWYYQLLIRQKNLFQFLLGDRLQVSQYSRRIYFSYDETGEKIRKVVLLAKTKTNSKGSKDLLDYGFYCYCKEKKIKISEYDEENEQDAKDEKAKSWFKLNNKKVICDSKESSIKIGNKSFDINLQLGTNIFDEFDKILNDV